MEISIVLIIIAVVVGVTNGSKYVVTTNEGIWSFLIACIASAVALSEESKYGSITTLVYIPGMAILLGAAIVGGNELRQLSIRMYSYVTRKYLENANLEPKKLWVIASLVIACVIFLFIGISHHRNKPFRELRKMISCKTISEDMLERGTEWYDIVTTSEGRDLVFEQLQKDKTNNDISSALWLLSIMPSSVTDEYIPDEIGLWIIEYAQTNGKYFTNKDESAYRRITYYELDDYYVIIPTLGGIMCSDQISALVKDGTEYDFDDNHETNYQIAEIPFYGMTEENINYTGLGRYSNRELCRDYYLLESDHRSITFYWYDNAGKLIFKARTYGGKVITTVDYRGNQPVFDSPSDHIDD